MPFDPAIPQENTPIDAAPIREQFTSLKALIDAIEPVSAAQVDGVSTLPPGAAAAAGVSLSTGVLHFTFAIPEGNTGAPGPQGNEGAQGPQGNTGAQGPPFANALVDGVSTLPPGSSASVSVSFDGTNVHFTFGIPQGNDGATGAQGPPGEVTQSDLNGAVQNALAQTSSNSNAVSTLSQSADASYSATQMQDVLNKIDELINALRR